MARVVISGLTAAGKTTHAKLLARQLGYRYFSSSAVLRQLLNRRGDGHWDQSWDSQRSQQSVDYRLDQLVVEAFRSYDDCVFDAHALPWTGSGAAIRIWIDSDLESRARKVVVSRLERREDISIDAARQVAIEKDRFSRQTFRELHGFDLFVDRSVFDVILSNGELIDVPSIRSSQIGIAAFYPVVLGAVTDRMGDSRTMSQLTNFQRRLILRPSDRS